LTLAIAIGGEDGGHARVTLAEVLFDLDRATEAWAQLDALRQVRIDSAAPYHLAGELLEERGDHPQALTWFNMAVSRLTDQEMSERDTELGFLSYANNILGGRRRIRQALGMPTDELDDSVSSVTEHGEELTRALTPPTPPREMRVLFWPRNEMPRTNNMTSHTLSRSR
jgi:hypothetical protein